MKENDVAQKIADRLEELSIDPKWFFAECDNNPFFCIWIKQFYQGKSVMVFNSARKEMIFKEICEL